MNNAPSPLSALPSNTARTGFVYGVLAYTLWGVIPLYFKLLKMVPAISIVASRIAFSLILLAFFLFVSRGWGAVRNALVDRRTILLLTASAGLIGVNWILFVHAINSGHILASSLAYYLNPLANILLGRFLLRERLSRLQWVAVGIAAVGIAVLAAGALGELWISLVLCGTFALYGLVRKIVAADALAGLAIETGLLLPFALTWLVHAHVPGTPAIAATPHLSLLVALSGVVTTVPLLLFTAAARRLPYSTVGMLQFIAPTLQLMVAVLIYREPFSQAHAIAFAAIWAALALYCYALISAARRDRLPSAADSAMLAEC